MLRGQKNTPLCYSKVKNILGLLSGDDVDIWPICQSVAARIKYLHKAPASLPCREIAFFTPIVKFLIVWKITTK